MNQRPNILKGIHKAIRAVLGDLLVKGGRLDFADAEALAAYRSQAQWAFEFLIAHAEHENAHVLPLASRSGAKVVHALESQHEGIDRQIGFLLGSITTIDATRSDARARGYEFLVKFSRFVGEFYLHMADEEEHLLPAIWEGSTDEEIRAAHGAIIASIPKEELAVELGWIIPSVSTPERIEMFAGARATMPPPVYDFLRGIARTSLTPEEDAALEAGLETALAMTA